MQAWMKNRFPIIFNRRSTLEQFVGFSTKVYLKGWSTSKLFSLFSLLRHFAYFCKFSDQLTPACFCVNRSYVIFFLKDVCDRSTFPCDWRWYGPLFVISMFLFLAKRFNFTVKLFSSIPLKCPRVFVLIKSFFEFGFYSPWMFWLKWD